MMQSDNARYSKITLFELFTSALGDLVRMDSALFSWPRNKIPVTHALATRIEAAMRRSAGPAAEPYHADMGFQLTVEGETYYPDIVLHDRTSSGRLMAIICRDGYLSEGEQAALGELQEHGGFSLVLGMAFLPQKPYLLLYRPTDATMEYHHFSREDLDTDMLKIREADTDDDSDQLTLGITSRRNRRR